MTEFTPEENKSDQSADKTDNKMQQKIDTPQETSGKANSKDQITSQNKTITNEKIKAKDSLFKRVLENGFDGVTTNPNYKLLALLIILLINLSLFFVVGNIGKSFLKNSGILS